MHAAKPAGFYFRIWLVHKLLAELTIPVHISTLVREVVICRKPYKYTHAD